MLNKKNQVEGEENQTFHSHYIFLKGATETLSDFANETF